MTPNISTFKGRSVNYDLPVEVYRNLNRGGYSIRQKGKVVGHTNIILMRDTAFVVNKSGYERMLREGRRNVHAWVRGYLVNGGVNCAKDAHETMAKLHYDRNQGCFTDFRNTTPLRGAQLVALNDRGAFYWSA